MRLSKHFLKGLIALGALLPALTTGAAIQDSSSPRNKLAAWAGHWKVRIDTKETQFDHAKTEYYDAQCSLQPHAAFIVCDYQSQQPDEQGHILTDLGIISYSDVDKTFKYTGVFLEGGPKEGVMLVDGNVWTRPLHVQVPGGGVADARRIYEFVSPDKQLARLEVSTDKGAHWTVIDEAVGTRER